MEIFVLASIGERNSNLYERNKGVIKIFRLSLDFKFLVLMEIEYFKDIRASLVDDISEKKNILLLKLIARKCVQLSTLLSANGSCFGGNAHRFQ